MFIYTKWGAEYLCNSVFIALHGERETVNVQQLKYHVGQVPPWSSGTHNNDQCRLLPQYHIIAVPRESKSVPDENTRFEIIQTASYPESKKFKHGNQDMLR